MASRRDNMKRIFVGNLPPDVRQRDLEDLFYKFGKIAFIDLKTRRGPPFAFVEFNDYRDAEEAVRCRDGKKWEGNILRVEFPRGRERTSKYRNGSGSSRNSAPQRRSKYRVTVKGLPPSGSWQDLKDHMREIGEVCFADVYKNGEGVVEFLKYDDMRYAIKKLNDTKFRSHEGEASYITLREDTSRGDSRSRSRSPVSKRRSSPTYSPTSKRRPSHSVSRSRSPSRSPNAGRRSHNKRPRRDRSESPRARSQSRSRSRSRSKSPASRSRSATPRSARGSSRGSPGARSRSASRSASRSPSHSPRNKDEKSSRGSPTKSRSRSRTPSRSPSQSSQNRDAKASPQADRASAARSRSGSRSPTPEK